MFHAGDGLLLPQWGWRPPFPNEGGDWRHHGGHHWTECEWISAIYVRPLQATQVSHMAIRLCYQAGILECQLRTTLQRKWGSSTFPSRLVKEPCFKPRYGALTLGNVQKAIPSSFEAKAPPMLRKIAVRHTAQVSVANLLQLNPHDPLSLCLDAQNKFSSIC